MNRKKRAAQVSVPTLILLFGALVILCTGGVSYVVLKNRQVTARREIEKIHETMEKHRVLMTLHKTDIVAALDVYDIRRRIREGSLPLAEIPIKAIEPLRTEPAQPVTEGRVARR